MRKLGRRAAAFGLGATALAGGAAAQGGGQAPRVLRVMGYQSTFVQYREGWQHTLREFERRNPGVRIEETATAFDQTLNQITVATLGGNAPDVVIINPIWMAQLHSINALEPLEPHVPADELALFPRRIMEDLTIDGSVRGVALNPGVIMMIYNRDLLREAGLDPDNPPRSWPEFNAAVRRIGALPPREDGRVYGVVLRTERQPIAAQWTVPIIWAHGGEVTDGSGQLTLDTPAARAAFAWYQDVVRSGFAPENATVADTRNLFAKGRAGFIFEGPWINGLVNALSANTRRIARDGNMWAAPMPADVNGRSRNFANHGVLSVTRQARDKELAARFIRFAVGDRDVVEFAFSTAGVISTSRLDLLTSGKQGADPFSQLFVRAFDSAIALPMKHPRWAAAMEPIAVALQRVIQGADPAAELGQAEREARRIMARR